MTCIPPRPILAEDPLAYFVPLAARPAYPLRPLGPISAIEQMYAYYTAE